MLFSISGTKFARNANGNTPRVASDYVDDVIKVSENDFTRLFKWFG